MQATAREQFLKSVFPEGVPLLWCPPVTHYQPGGALDQARMAAHWRHLVPHVGGFLVPGSTGDGWELTVNERRLLIASAIGQAHQFNTQILIGALHPDAKEAVKLIQEDMEWLCSLRAERDPHRALAQAHVCGFTICPPRGKHLNQDDIRQGLSSILELGVPTAIYQLPQVTLNEISPDLAAELAARYENFIFFKDTSGADRVAVSAKDLRGVFVARGAEGNYAQWLKAAGGPYHGFLLSSANVFASELHQIIQDILAGREQSAKGLSERVAAVVTEALRLATDLPQGNPFANGNKALDHFFAFGAKAATEPPPRLHDGSSLPVELIQATGKILAQQGLMPQKGYLD